MSYRKSNKGGVLDGHHHPLAFLEKLVGLQG